MRARILLLIIGFLAASGLPARAQEEPDTRAGLLREAREKKAEALSQPQPGAIERALLLIENERILERLLNPAEGFYPKVGNITPGSGFAGGPAYRKPGLVGGHAVLGLWAMASVQRYWTLDAALRFPTLADERLFAELHAERFDYPSEDFFGLGPDSLRAAHTVYGMSGARLGGRAGARFSSWVSVGGGVDHLSPRIDNGDDGRPIDALFDAAAAPGLGDRTDFLRYEAFAEFNYREPRGNPRRGGRYLIAVQQYDDRDLDRYSFTRVEADLQQYVPFYTDRRVLALHAHVSTSDADAGQQVPFYFQRTLGGPDDLRGFRRFRFRDEHILLLQAEYRWEIFTAMDGALFFDAGKVASRREDLTLKDLESDYGIGFRFGTINGVFLRVEGAFGSAGGRHFVLRFGHVF
jgi:hypothetical protein